VYNNKVPITLPPTIIEPLRTNLNLHHQGYAHPLTFHAKFSEWHAMTTDPYARYLGANANNSDTLKSGNYSLIHITYKEFKRLIRNNDILTPLDSDLPTRTVIITQGKKKDMDKMSTYYGDLVNRILTIDIKKEDCVYYNNPDDPINVDEDHDIYRFHVFLMENVEAKTIDPINMDTLVRRLQENNPQVNVRSRGSHGNNHHNGRDRMRRENKKRAHGNYTAWHITSEKDHICQWFEPLIPVRTSEGKDPSKIPAHISSFNRIAGQIGIIPDNLLDTLSSMNIHIEQKKGLTNSIYVILRNMSTSILRKWTRLKYERDK
jgi:hypothetical protein